MTLNTHTLVFNHWLEFMDMSGIHAHRATRQKRGGGPLSEIALPTGAIGALIKGVFTIIRLIREHREFKRKLELPEICLSTLCLGGAEQAMHYMRILPELQRHMQEKHPTLHFRHSVIYSIDQPNSLGDKRKNVTITIPRGVASTSVVNKTIRLMRNVSDEKIPAREHLQWNLALGLSFFPKYKWTCGTNIENFERLGV